MYIPWDKSHTSNISIIITLYLACNPFMRTIVFNLSESSKITLFKVLIGKIIETKVGENSFFLLFSVTLNSIIFRIKS